MSDDKLFDDIFKKSKSEYALIESDKAWKRLPTGSLAIDNFLGGGLPMGAISMIYGHPSSGKSTLAMITASYLIRSKPDAKILYIDAEHSFDWVWAKKLGLNEKNVKVVQTDTLEKSVKIMGAGIESKKLDLIIFDSVVSLASEKEDEGNIGDVHIAPAAKVWTLAMKKYIHPLKFSDTVVLLLNQISSTIATQGSPFVIPGGNKIQFACQIINRVRIKKRLDASKGSEGFIMEVNATVTGCKNKTIDNARWNEPIDVQFVERSNGEPIYEFDLASDLVDLGRNYGVLTDKDGSLIPKGGRSYFYNGEQIGSSKEDAIDFIRANPDKMLEIRNDLYEVMSK